MYGSKEIKIALRKYIASTGNKTIDEQSVVDILDGGADRDFDKASQIVKEIRHQFRVGQSIPEWLRMLTFRLIYDYLSIEYEKKMEYDSKEENRKKRKFYKMPTQISLLEALGLNKKVFDRTSSWNMYSPEMKLRQSKYKALSIPFTYAETETKPIYVAMLHHIISESRIITDTFVDVFGKMGYVPAFCAEGYAKKVMFTPNADLFKKYYKGITDNPIKTYDLIQRYGDIAKEILGSLDGLRGRAKLEEFERRFYDYKAVRVLCSIKEPETKKNDDCNKKMSETKADDFCEYAALKFCDMCFNMPYWKQGSIIDGEYVQRFDSQKAINKVFEITLDDFLAYANALKKVDCRNADDFEVVQHFLYNYDNLDDIDISEQEFEKIFKKLNLDKKSLLYVDIPKYKEYDRYDLDNYSDGETALKIEENIMSFLFRYEGDWIMTLKEYSLGDKKAHNHYNDIIRILRTFHRKLYIYKCSIEDPNISTSISFATTINFDMLLAEEFEDKYHIKVYNADKGDNNAQKKDKTKYKLSKQSI
ncbi:hypothetical protein [Agathobacter rectalis]|uniref:Uncharacterized protein n=1 Tax=Agathobacter rectalis TaxID=39491 RepID=A0A2U2EFM6_9FIRM|nr:hypothetical protein [Agathobacter rectalis]PWE83311.1 hypothetical protein LD38_10740 [Agathobacter rectalis]